MTSAALPPLRNERTAAARGTHSAPRGSSASPDLNPDDQTTIAAQRGAFDYEAAERAEIEREHEALEALLMAFLKNEDEIMKKWISLI